MLESEIKAQESEIEDVAKILKGESFEISKLLIF